MENDKGAFFLADFGDGRVLSYDNAEAARKVLRADAEVSPDMPRRLWKVLPYHDPVEIMI